MLYVYLVMVEGAEDPQITAHRSAQGAEIEIVSRYPGDGVFEDGTPFGPDMLEDALERNGSARVTFAQIESRPDYEAPACPKLRIERHVLGV